MGGEQRYREFLKKPPAELLSNRNLDAMKATVGFMLHRGVGVRNSVSTREIVEHLQGLDYDLTAQQWQVKVLGPLRRAGVYIGAGRGKIGMFLIDTRADGEVARAAQIQRLEAERRHLDVLETLIEEL